MDARSIEKRVRELAAQAAENHNLEFVHVEVAGSERNYAVRVFVDKPDGVTHKDLAEVSLYLGTLLDVEDFISSAYTLEVSSPGLERGLYKLEDYERFAGRLAKIKLRQPVETQRNFRGRIIGVENKHVVFEDKTRGRVLLPFELIVKANLEIDVEAEFRFAEERSKRLLRGGAEAAVEDASGESSRVKI